MIVEQREVRTTVKLHASELLRSDEKSRINYSVDNPPARACISAHRSARLHKSIRDLFSFPIQKIDCVPMIIAKELRMRKRVTMIDRAIKIFSLRCRPKGGGRHYYPRFFFLLRTYTGRNCFFLSVAKCNILVLLRVNCALPSRMRAQH